MASYAYTIQYRDQYNQNFDCITAVSMDAGFDQVSSYTAVEGVTSDLYNGIKIDHGSRYIEQVELVITLIKKNYTDFSNTEKRNILRWLSSSKYCSWLSLYDVDGEKIADVYGRFSSVEEKVADSRVIGFVATFKSPYPYFFSSIRNIKQTFVGSETIILENDTDAIDDLVRPYITIKPSKNIDTLTILNEETNRKSIIKNIKANETITIDNENKLIFSDDMYKIIGQDFYGVVDSDFVTSYPVWIELVPGDNKLIIDVNDASATVDYQIAYRYPIKLGSTF
jgi:hypothetical protein